MRFASISLLVSFMLVSGGASQEKKDTVQKGDPIKLKAIKVDCSIFETTWGAKTKDPFIWKTEERKGDKSTWNYELKFLLTFDRDLQANEVRTLQLIFNTVSWPIGTQPMLYVMGFDAESVATGRRECPYGQSIQGELSGKKGDAVRVTIRFGNEIQWEKTIRVVARGREFDRTIAEFEEAIRLNPNSAAAYNSLSWLLATCPEAKYRDGKKAVAIGKKAVELDPKNGNFMDTLAAAYAESGDFAAAVRWQEMALQSPGFKDNPSFRQRLELYRSMKPFRD